ncbi:MAG: right-handed parallel beta-helix repeat-containing protein, partial [Planctomycetota bacterium]
MKTQPTSIQSCSRDGDESGRTATHHYPKDLGRWILVLGAILLLSSTLCGGKPEKTGKPPKEEPPEEEPSEETPSEETPSNGTTYYVATNGDDSADGLSLETPWQRIQKAADTMVAGDTVQIRGGTYIERILPRNGGSEGMPITYQAYLDEEVVIQGKNISKWDSCIRIYSLSAKDVNYITLKNLILDGSYNSDSTDWGVCGSGVSICGVPDNPIHDIVMTGITCRNLFRGIALENFVDNCTVSSCNISESQWGIITTGSNAPYNLVIHDNRISNGVL